MQLDDGARVAGVFTQNRFCAAPVIVAREHLAQRAGRSMRALVVNTGNANAGTGERGARRGARDLRASSRSCSAARRRRCCRSRPASSWSRCRSSASSRGCPRCIADLRAGQLGATPREAIMTTDTVPKAASRRVSSRRRRRSPSPASPRAPGMIRPEHGDDAGLRRDRRARQRRRSLQRGGRARGASARSTASRSTATPRPTILSC